METYLKTPIWKTILEVLGAVIIAVLKIFRNKQVQERTEKVEQESEIQLQQSKQQAGQTLQTELDTIVSFIEDGWEEWKYGNRRLIYSKTMIYSRNW